MSALPLFIFTLVHKTCLTLLQQAVSLTFRSMCRMRKAARYFMPLAMSRANLMMRVAYSGAEL